jgi:hypothetical protein
MLIARLKSKSRHSGIVYVVSWPLTLYLILRSVPGYPANRCRSWCVAAGVVGLFGAAVEFSQLLFVTACLGGDGFQGQAELVDLDL